MARSSHLWDNIQMSVEATPEDFCCGIKYTFEPVSITCEGTKDCYIAANATYHSYKGSSFCLKCFKNRKHTRIMLKGGDLVKKASFHKKINNVGEEEPIIKCKECRSIFHQICKRELWASGYVCEKCLAVKGLSEKEYTYAAKNLPETPLSNYVEQKLRTFLEQQGCMEEVIGSICVRQVVSVKGKAQVMENFERYIKSTSPQQESVYPYQSKMLIGFQQIDDVDVMFFTIIVQEYDDDCPPPNKGQVYLSYVDSVQYFEPRKLRTEVYQQIILAYFDYASKMGFKLAHIWVCPPQLGSDYIFFMHPKNQKIPDIGRLRKWYKELFKKGNLPYKTLLEHIVKLKMTDIQQIPYFDGDFWPTLIEEIVQKDKKALHKPPPCKKRKVPKKSNPVEKYTSKFDDPLMIKLIAEAYRLKENFFVVDLNPGNKKAINTEELIHCEFLENRDKLMNLCQEHHYEFSSLRRAKFSTMSILSEVCYNYSNYNEDEQDEDKENELVPKKEMIVPAVDTPDADFILKTKVLKLLFHSDMCKQTRCNHDIHKDTKDILEHLKTSRKSCGCQMCDRLSKMIDTHERHCIEKCRLPFCCKLREERLRREEKENQSNAEEGFELNIVLK